MNDDEMRDWLKSHEIKHRKLERSMEYDCPKAAMVSSCEPFGLMGIYVNDKGAEVWFINGKHSVTFLEE